MPTKLSIGQPTHSFVLQVTGCTICGEAHETSQCIPTNENTQEIYFMGESVEARCRNLPFGGRATRDSRVRVPRKEYTRSHHQRLFEENVRRTGKDVIYEP